jgi:hypothetical protein
MTLLSKKKRNEVISLRLTEERMDILERYRDVLAQQLRRPISLGEAAFRVFEERADDLDRQSLKFEMLQHPTASLFRIRKKWESEHNLSSPEWDVIAEFVQIACEERCQTPPLFRPAIPCRESYLGLLNAFEAVYQNRKKPASKHAWYYFGNLDGHHSTGVQLSDSDSEQRNQAVLNQIEQRRKLLLPEKGWENPGNVGRCFLAAVRDEEVEGTRLSQILAPHWPALWRLAARGHWIRNDGNPVRQSGAHEDDFRLRSKLPEAAENEEQTLRLAFLPTDRDLTLSVNFNGVRRCGFMTSEFPAMVELHNMLETLTFDPVQPWRGRTFNAFPADDKKGYSLLFEQDRLFLSLSREECFELRDLMRRLWESAELQPWREELTAEYGEQG